MSNNNQTIEEKYPLISQYRKRRGDSLQDQHENEASVMNPANPASPGSEQQIGQYNNHDQFQNDINLLRSENPQNFESSPNIMTLSQYQQLMGHNNDDRDGYKNPHINIQNHGGSIHGNLTSSQQKILEQREKRRQQKQASTSNQTPTGNIRDNSGVASLIMNPAVS